MFAALSNHDAVHRSAAGFLLFCLLVLALIVTAARTDRRREDEPTEVVITPAGEWPVWLTRDAEDTVQFPARRGGDVR